MKAEKRYELMTKAERRVAIAKDVIKQVNAGVIDARAHSGYLIAKANFDHTDCVIEKENAVAVAKQCYVCARGAMMISRIAKFNKVRVNAIGGVVSHHTRLALSDAFTNAHLEEIESVFEYSPMWCKNHPDDNDRLIAIMQNIIDHDGKFKREVEYVVNYVK